MLHIIILIVIFHTVIYHTKQQWQQLNWNTMFCSDGRSDIITSYDREPLVAYCIALCNRPILGSPWFFTHTRPTSTGLPRSTDHHGDVSYPVHDGIVVPSTENAGLWNVWVLLCIAILISARFSATISSRLQYCHMQRYMFRFIQSVFWRADCSIIEMTM